MAELAKINGYDIRDKKLADEGTVTDAGSTDYVLLEDTNGNYQKISKSNFTEAIRNTLGEILMTNDKGTSITSVPVISGDGTSLDPYDLGSATTENLASVLGGSMSAGELVNISLVTNQSSSSYDSDLIGATITITDNTESTILLNTTWDGTDISFEIPVPVNYTISVGSITGYKTPSSITYDSRTGRNRNLEFQYQTEVVTVNCSASNGSSVAGQKVTVYGTQYTLDATGIITTNIAYSTSYSVIAGSWDGYDSPANQTFTAGQTTRSVNVVWKYNPIAVDMGLPSGVKWAKMNIDVTRPNKFAASEYQYECSFFSWGNVQGHNPTSESAFSYDWGTSNDGAPYVSTTGHSLTGDIPVSATYDAARANCGAPWRMPTATEFQELIDNCDFINPDGSVIPTSTANKLVTVNGIVGIYLKSKNNSNRLFFACSGSGYQTSWSNRTTYGNYWSSTLYSATFGEFLYFYSGGVYPQHYNVRFLGFTVRPVQ